MIVYKVLLECHEDNGTPYPELCRCTTREQAQAFIDNMRKPDMYYAFIQEARVPDKYKIVRHSGAMFAPTLAVRDTYEECQQVIKERLNDWIAYEGYDLSSELEIVGFYTEEDE